MITTGTIEKYLDGKMSSQEEAKFLEQVKNDPNLKEALCLQAEINESIADNQKEDLRHLIRDVMQENSRKIKWQPNNNQKRRRLYTKTALIAASVLFLISLGGILYLLESKKYSASELYVVYYQPYKPSLTTRDVQINKVDSPALNAYLEGNYALSANLFSEILQDDPENGWAMFYGGLSYLETNQEHQAIANFESIVNSNFYPYYYHAQWYLGMAYLKSGQISDAVETFKNIKQNNKYYSTKAEQLLSKLRS